ncbi:uncharacterized protein LOC109710830 [Ananas comosus]|uniref:Uncharacterized protein LOC109706584 n=1 Tax=Ananas comosus TaxID=4615 RepID=A0A199W212_ANACO|nr:uncharacterized protein LOC109706584 [Ananas comosus]XP_020089199.1 uncharacterized protein LOC109710830 [Ananas comosus]OAY83329.1 hypothetical protein ACMD2_04341 [Ananas comosus]
MCIPVVLVCDEEERVVGAPQQAPGSCPFCGGGVVAADVESACRFCFLLPICFRTKRRFHCSSCSRPLVPFSTPNFPAYYY